MTVPASTPTDLSDPLGASLHLLRLEGTLYNRSELTAPWSISIPCLDDLLSFLVVTQGRCFLVLDGQDPIRVDQGDLVILPHGTPHTVCSETGLAAVPLFDIPVEKISERLEVLRHGGGGDMTLTMYGCVRFDHIAAHYLIKHLPQVIHIDSWDGDMGTWLQSTLRFAAREAAELRPGGETVITRLSDILVIQALRFWLDNAPDARRGWLAALRDPQIGRAMAMIHGNPGSDLSIGGLASAVGMSRSAFAARFTAQVGVAPMAYARHWRLSIARNRIARTTDPQAVIAHDLGYQSEAAFCRAFRREFNISPGSLRRASVGQDGSEG
jgi:AraC-like DNA-binding protein